MFSYYDIITITNRFVLAPKEISVLFIDSFHFLSALHKFMIWLTYSKKYDWGQNTAVDVNRTGANKRKASQRLLVWIHVSPNRVLMSRILVLYEQIGVESNMHFLWSKSPLLQHSPGLLVLVRSYWSHHTYLLLPYLRFWCTFTLISHKSCPSPKHFFFHANEFSFVFFYFLTTGFSILFPYCCR